ncbi:MAG: D-3-phosphoglycerate dehydrogenase [Flavobacteriales bacterium]|jgi:D-3-phosphoglycerate dehydrogenase
MRILFIDSVHSVISESFVALEWTCDFCYEESKEVITSKIHDYDGIIIRSRFKLDAEFLRKASQLKFIGRPGAGLENIDTDFCTRNNIEVFRSPEGNRDAVSEHIIGSLLMLFNNLKIADSEVRQGIWKREENRGLELMGKTIGIIGFGYMGAAFAQRLQGFGARILSYDKYKSNYAPDYVTEVSLETLKSEVDIISLHIPQTAETIGMVNKEFISSIQKPFYLINSARGKSVKLEDLVEGIKSNKVLGACLDVLEYESSSFENAGFETDTFQYLAKSNKTVLTPHIAGWTHEAQLKMGVFLKDKIISKFG